MNDFVLLKLQTATLKPHTTPMNADRILDRVCVAFDVLIEAGAAYEGLFPSLIDRETHKMVTDCRRRSTGREWETVRIWAAT